MFKNKFFFLSLIWYVSHKISYLKEKNTYTNITFARTLISTEGGIGKNYQCVCISKELRQMSVCLATPTSNSGILGTNQQLLFLYRKGHGLCLHTWNYFLRGDVIFSRLSFDICKKTSFDGWFARYDFGTYPMSFCQNFFLEKQICKMVWAPRLLGYFLASECPEDD